MNLSKKTCKLCKSPAQMSLTMQVTTVGAKKRARVSAKSVQLCFACGSLWGVALSSGVAEPYCEAVGHLTGRANASLEHSASRAHVVYDAADGSKPLRRIDERGIVYLYESLGVFKIGRSSEGKLANRMKIIRGHTIVGGALRHAFGSNNAWIAERELHERFAHRRVHGEWFRLQSSEIAEIQAITGDFDVSLDVRETQQIGVPSFDLAVTEARRIVNIAAARARWDKAKKGASA